MPKRGTGQFTRDDWKNPTEAMRTSKGRRFTLTPEVHEKLDAQPEGTRSAHTDAALRLWFRMPARDDAPPRPK